MFRRGVAHQSVAVHTDVADADIVAPDHEDVRLLARLRRLFLDCLVVGRQGKQFPSFRLLTTARIGRSLKLSIP